MLKPRKTLREETEDKAEDKGLSNNYRNVGRERNNKLITEYFNLI